ncbi:MAG: RHS repeat-associated core domain-containing protein [Prevotella sp.]|nr:RHS repeat-associated core domain-containing protein [Prevotella sp.]
MSVTTADGETSGIAYNALNQLLQRADTQGQTNFFYDKRGNRVLEESPDGIKRYTYDAMGMLAHGTNEQNEQSSYTYNSLGFRIQRSQTLANEKSENLNYVVDFTSPIRRDLMVKVENEFTQSLIYANGQLIEEVTQNRTNEGGLPRLLAVHEDIMGSIRSLTTEHGDVFAEIQYDVWGKPIHSGDHDINGALLDRYTNHTYDSILDAYHAQYRFYDAKNRAFMSIDPIKDGLNWYNYCAANPTTCFDPLGRAVMISKEAVDPYAGTVYENKVSSVVFTMVTNNNFDLIVDITDAFIPFYVSKTISKSIRWKTLDYYNVDTAENLLNTIGHFDDTFSTADDTLTAFNWIKDIAVVGGGYVSEFADEMFRVAGKFIGNLSKAISAVSIIGKNNERKDRWMLEYIAGNSLGLPVYMHSSEAAAKEKWLYMVGYIANAVANGDLAYTMSYVDLLGLKIPIAPHYLKINKIGLIIEFLKGLWDIEKAHGASEDLLKCIFNMYFNQLNCVSNAK